MRESILLRQLFDRESYTYTYLIADLDAGVALLIDPVAECLPDYLQLLTELDVTLKVAIDTHCHADHITALGQLREETDCETIVGSPSMIECASRFIGDGQSIGCGRISLRAIYTPGHTDDSYCYYLEGEHPVVFTGDTLLIRGTGRTDFQNGSAEDLYDSLFNKLLTLPPDTVVYPGHDYKGWSQSTIFEERRWNPRLQVGTWQELDLILSRLNLGDPKLMDVAIPANLKCGRKLFI
jgi:sulfur dioxygenase|tara:strand:- start:102 stop:815 length:714 start_codon:yes stop_codon:yes gene_type:complete